MNDKIIIEKLKRADEVLSRMRHNILMAEYDDYNRRFKKDAARLKNILAEVELLIEP